MPPPPAALHFRSRPPRSSEHRLGGDHAATGEHGGMKLPGDLGQVRADQLALVVVERSAASTGNMYGHNPTDCPKRPETQVPVTGAPRRASVLMKDNTSRLHS